MNRRTTRIVATLSPIAAPLTSNLQPVPLIHEILGCDESALEPLMLVIHQVVVLLFIIGALLAAGSLAYAGVAMMWGSERAKQRAIQRVQMVLMGVVVLWAGPFVIGFLLVPLNVCEGGF